MTADLTEAEKLFDEWVALGYSPTEAMERVKASGVLEEAERAATFERMGMSKEAAATAARGRNPRPATDHGRMIERFERLGMTRAAAEIAAKGRGGTTAGGSKSVREVRESADDSLWWVELLREVERQHREVVELREQMRQTDAREAERRLQRWKSKKNR